MSELGPVGVFLLNPPDRAGTIPDGMLNRQTRGDFFRFCQHFVQITHRRIRKPTDFENCRRGGPLQTQGDRFALDAVIVKGCRKGIA